MFLDRFLYNSNSLSVKLLVVIIITYLSMRITKKHLLVFVFLSFFSLAQAALFKPVLVLAQASSGGTLVDSQEGLTEIGRVYGANGGEPQDIRYVIARIINIILGFLGVIFFGLTIFAGFQYMTSAGNEEQSKKAVALLRNAVIGLLIILVSWAISRYILIVLGGAVNNTAGYLQYRTYP